MVRLGPIEISVNSADALRTVYVGGFEKYKWYFDTFVNYGTLSRFTVLRNKPHSVQKRLVSNVYSNSSLQNSKDLQTISDHIISNWLLPTLHQIKEYGVEEHGGELGIIDFMQAVGMDFTSACLFGLFNGIYFIHDVDYRRYWLHEYQICSTQLARDRAGEEVVETWYLYMCEAAKRFMNSENTKMDPLQTQPIVYRRLANSPRESAPMDDISIASEMLDHLIAGHDSPPITLTYLMHELSQRPHL